MKSIRTSVMAAVGALVFASHVSAAPIAIAVHNTGVDAADVLVASGAQAAFWQLLSAPIGATEAVGSPLFAFKHPAYAANTAVSQWVSPASSGGGSASGFYVYELPISLAGLDPSTASISGFFSSDNDGFVRLNGGAPVLLTAFGAFGTMHPFTINSGFTGGTNSIQVGVNNAGNPTAVHVQITSATAEPSGNPPPVPEPATLALFGGGLLALAHRRSRRVE